MYQPQYGGYSPAGMPQFGGERAGFWSRFLGSLLDGLVGILFVLPAIALIIVSFAAGHDALCRDSGFSSERGYHSCREPNAALFLLGLLLVVVGIVGWWAFMSIRLGRTGQTPGRRAAGIKVVDKYTGRPIGAGKALGRGLFGYFISGQICYLGYLWMLWDADKQTWHDKVVNSIVVRT
jgi:uncharacterized RDD family membrane protein YckC